MWREIGVAERRKRSGGGKRERGERGAATGEREGGWEREGEGEIDEREESGVVERKRRAAAGREKGRLGVW